MNALRTISILCLLTLAPPVLAQEQGPVSGPSVRGQSRPGFTLALGTASTRLDLGDDADQLFSRGPVEFKKYGRGGLLELGYAFNREFALQLRAVGSEHSTGNVDQTLSFGQFQLDAIVTLTSKGWVWPYLAGGIGGAAINLEEDGVSSTLAGGSADFGGGVEVVVSKHFALSFDYRFAIQNFEREVLENGGDRDVDLSSTSQTLQFRVVYSF